MNSAPILFFFIMNDLKCIRALYRIQTKVKTGFAPDRTDDSKTSLAKIKSPLETIIDCRRIDNEHITKKKHKNI